MSATVKAALLASKDLRPNERLILVAIAAHTNRDGDAWPSVATIAEYAGVSTRTVQRCLAKLVELGRLAVRTAAGIATRVYRLVTGQGDSSATEAPEAANGGDSLAVTRSFEDHSKEKRAEARDWRRFLPKGKKSQVPVVIERRGAALPVTGAQCAKHRGSPAGNCGPCRAEALGGVA